MNFNISLPDWVGRRVFGHLRREAAAAAERHAGMKVTRHRSYFGGMIDVVAHGQVVNEKDATAS